MTTTRLTVVAVCSLLLATPAVANSARDSILAGYLDAAKSADAGFTAFSAQRGETLFRTNHGGGTGPRPQARVW